MKAKLNNLVLLGPPGAGKGTLAQKLKEALKLRHISTGDLFRSNIAEQTPIGIEAQSYIQAGKLVPDTVTTGMVYDCLKNLSGGFILDGYPRNIDQAAALQDICKELNKPLDYVIEIQVPDETVVTRLSSRVICRDCGRPYNLIYQKPLVDGICDDCGGELYLRKDDNPDTIRERLTVYHRDTEPLINYYKELNLWYGLDGDVLPQVAVDTVLRLNK